MTLNRNATSLPERKLVSVSELAFLVGLPAARLRRFAVRGVIPRIELSRRKHLYCVDDVVEALAAFGRSGGQADGA